MPLFYEGKETEETAKLHLPHKENFEPQFPKLQLHEESPEQIAGQPKPVANVAYAVRCIKRGIRRKPRTCAAFVPLYILFVVAVLFAKPQ
ncbi:MAG: hypothetical protein CL902_00490 [Dehalococcoidia bacterium]|nr:hypothetical protein [Dehalococcoidia bacterium]